MKNFSFFLLLLFYGWQSFAVPFNFGETVTLYSDILQEDRILNIGFPIGFSDTTTYPVIYVLDGSAHEDFIHIAGLVQFLTMYSLMPPSIIVGIANVDRKRDFTFPTEIEQHKIDFPTTGGSAKFIDFLETELIPFITKNYPINNTEMLIGQSLGGLLATEVLTTKPTLFDQYIIVSPSLWWNRESLLKKELNSAIGGLNLRVVVCVGTEGRIMQRNARKLVKKLKRTKVMDVDFMFFPKENHVTILHSALYSALRRVYEAK